MNDKIINISVESFTTESSDKGFKIVGLALPFNKRSRNGFLYRTESVEQTYKTLVGKPVLFNHQDDKVLGHITNAYIDKDGLHYEMDIDPAEKDIIRKVKRGDINRVSIRAIYTNPTQADEGFDVDIQEFLELSLVTVPGFADTTASAVEKLKQELGSEKSEFVKALEDCHYLDDEAFEKDKYPWDECVADQKRRGYSDDAAKKICAAIKNRSVKHMLDKNLASSIEEGIRIVGELIGYNSPIFELKQSEGDDKMVENVKKEEDEQTVATPDNEDNVQKFMDLISQIQNQLKDLSDRVAKLEGKGKEEEKPPEEKPPEQKPEQGEKLSRPVPSGEVSEKEITIEQFKQAIINYKN